MQIYKENWSSRRCSEWIYWFEATDERVAGVMTLMKLGFGVEKIPHRRIQGSAGDAGRLHTPAWWTEVSLDDRRCTADSESEQQRKEGLDWKLFGWMYFLLLEKESPKSRSMTP